MNAWRFAAASFTLWLVWVVSLVVILVASALNVGPWAPASYVDVLKAASPGNWGAA